MPSFLQYYGGIKESGDWIFCRNHIFMLEDIVISCVGHTSICHKSNKSIDMYGYGDDREILYSLVALSLSLFSF
jgi:hypothetical protein